MYYRIFISLLTIWICFNSECLSAPADSLAPYRLIVKEFYYDLLKKRFVSVADCDRLLTSVSLEYDEYLFFQGCNRSKSKNECIVLAKERYRSPSSYESLLFREFKKQKKRLTDGSVDHMDSLLLHLKMRSKGVIELRLSDGIVLFTFSNPDFEKLYITDVFLIDGPSIFNFVDGTQEKRYYK